MIFLAWVSAYIMGFALVMSVVSLITAPIYLFIKHSENNVSMYSVFAVIDAILTVFVCVILLPNCNSDTLSGVFAQGFSIIIIPTMIVCCIGAVIIDRVQYYKNKELQKLIDSEQEINGAD
ncbi:MAG: hypothetical protein ACI4XI_01385 [Ruminococcus sp.]